MQQGLVVVGGLVSSSPATAAEDGFVSAGYNRSEYTNSITASRDTNISPKEVYDTLQKVGRAGNNRALDVGAGAGVSTQVLWELGFNTIDALDWSSDAWNNNVLRCPDSVHFYQVDDERFLRQWRQDEHSERYDAIVFNFAINARKAVQFATELLNENGVLLAPVNVQDDYWMKQTYRLLDAHGKILWSASDVGAWAVQFQPDVTQDTCQGIWCPPYNGFRKER